MSYTEPWVSGCPGCPVVSGPCPVCVQWAVRLHVPCPVLSDIMSGICPKCPVGVRQCPISFGQDHVRLCPKCPVDSVRSCPIVSGCVRLSDHVRLCPIMSGCVRLCPIMSGCVRLCPFMSTICSTLVSHRPLMCRPGPITRYTTT